MTPASRRDLRTGLLFTLPWIIGFSVFVIYPVTASLYYSFCDYSVLAPAQWVGLANYRELFQDNVFRIALRNTLCFAAFSILLTFVCSLGMGLLLARERRAVRLYRTLFFLPVLIPQVAVAAVLLWVFNSEQGLVKVSVGKAVAAAQWIAQEIMGCVLWGWNALGLHHMPMPDWVARQWAVPPLPVWISQQWIMTTLVVASVWSIGNAMVIYIAGLQDVPEQLYEAADIDGASAWRKAWHISIPMISPMILFNLVMGIIAAFNVFAIPVFMTASNKSYNLGNAITFYSPLIQRTALDDLRMGYASAMAWILFAIVLGLTLLVMRFAMRRVHYGGGQQ